MSAPATIADAPLCRDLHIRGPRETILVCGLPARHPEDHAHVQSGVTWAPAPGQDADAAAGPAPGDPVAALTAARRAEVAAHARRLELQQARCRLAYRLLVEHDPSVTAELEAAELELARSEWPVRAAEEARRRDWDRSWW